VLLEQMRPSRSVVSFGRTVPSEQTCEVFFSAKSYALEPFSGSAQTRAMSHTWKEVMRPLSVSELSKHVQICWKTDTLHPHRILHV
jgi:hypothetical protein